MQQVGGRLGELRFDTDLDVSHAVVRYMEVLKLSALMERSRGGLTVADGILAQGFEPTPSWSACSMCDYRIACPAAER